MTPLITIEKQFIDYPFAHRQPNHAGHCSLIHGHNWSFALCLTAREMDECGFVLDFGRMGFIKDWLANHFDHTLVLNETDPMLSNAADRAVLERFSEVVTVPDCSCEGLAQYVAEKLNTLILEMTFGRVWVCWVEVKEDSKNSATCVLAEEEGGAHV
jgi:6-pyruvoyltetrahydropterin/6-carboxytetrahydropterin synthase